MCSYILPSIALQLRQPDAKIFGYIFAAIHKAWTRIVGPSEAVPDLTKLDEAGFTDLQTSKSCFVRLSLMTKEVHLSLRIARESLGLDRLVISAFLV